MGPLTCTRALTPILGGAAIAMNVKWTFGPKGSGKAYEEHAVFAVGDDGVLCFWSFTSDGKRSIGELADVTDIDPEAVGFHAQMPMGLARQAYFPAADGFTWVVESKNKSGWTRFTEHTYVRA